MNWCCSKCPHPLIICTMILPQCFQARAAASDRIRRRTLALRHRRVTCGLNPLSLQLRPSRKSCPISLALLHPLYRDYSFALRDHSLVARSDFHVKRWSPIRMCHLASPEYNDLQSSSEGTVRTPSLGSSLVSYCFTPLLVLYVVWSYPFSTS